MLVSDERRVNTEGVIDPSAFAVRFKKRRLQLGLTLEQMAERLGLAWQSVSGWEHGSLPRPTRYERVAAVLETTVEELFYGQPAPVRSPEQGIVLAATPRLDVPQIRDAGPIIGLRDRIPVIPWSLAGNWREQQKRFHPGDAESWIYVTVRVGEMAFGVRVTGDAMASPTDHRTLQDGTVVAIDPGRKPEHDSIVLAKRAGQTLLRLLWMDGDVPYLRALNGQYPLLDFPPGSEIIGVAVQATKDLL